MVRDDFYGRSFMPWMGVLLAMVVAGAFLLSIGQRWGIFLVPPAGCIPFAIQRRTGMALDHRWVARYPRAENPWRYWLQLSGALLLPLVWGIGAYGVFARAP